MHDENECWMCRSWEERWSHPRATSCTILALLHRSVWIHQEDCRNGPTKWEVDDELLNFRKVIDIVTFLSAVNVFLNSTSKLLVTTDQRKAELLTSAEAIPVLRSAVVVVILSFFTMRYFLFFVLFTDNFGVCQNMHKEQVNNLSLIFVELAR